ncbi:MAG: hypothetical protein A2133_06915 [Actinobacteria bacterium RBG_16_64_13]|nr:MAG: hypothetical protein A2133_06915 [Actinobacteria bacterium RBG_16_64_13]
MAAKLSLPHMGFVLSRPRLRTLVEPVHGGGVISLVAGPGYGKTAFVVDLLSSASGRTVYFSVDEGDRDPVRFLGYLMSGLGMDPVNRPEPHSLSWSAPGGTDADVLELTAGIVDFMSGLAGQTTLVAIDDLHLIDPSPMVVTVLDLVIRGLPPGWTLLLSSRRPLPLRIDGVSLGGRVVILHGRELRLTPQEVAAWAAHNWAVQLQPSEARALWRLTQGWPAALVLLGQRLLCGGSRITANDIAGVLARGRDLRMYLERDILSGLDSFAAATMLTAALLPRVIFPRDEAFLPGPHGEAETVLEDFVSRGFLVTRAGRRSYTLHPLVRGFAEREARRSNDQTGLIDRAAAHLERTGEYHQAASLYLRAGRYREAGRPLRALTLQSVGATVSFTRDEWLDLIPAGIPVDDMDGAWLLVTKARILQQQTKYAQAVETYERAARVLAAANDKEGLLPVLLGSAFCLSNQGLWDESLAVMKRCRPLARTPDEKVEVLVLEGGILVSLCRWDEAVENWERALALALPEARAALTQRICFHRSRLFYSLGHYRLAKPWVEKAMGNGNSPGTLARAVALNGAAILACLTGDYDQAGRWADDCQRLVRSRGYALVEISCLLTQATVALGRWDYRSAVIKIKEAQSLAARAGDAEESFWAEDMLGDLCRRNSNAQRALEHHRTALEIVHKNRLAVFEKVQAEASAGMDLAVLGRETEARASLDETVRVARRYGLMSSLAPALFYLGWLYARSGRESEAARSLGEAMRIAEEHDHVHFFSQEAKVALPVLALCDRIGAGAFVRAKIVPVLTERLRADFYELAEGKTYPTDVLLGSSRRRGLIASSCLGHGEEQRGSPNSESIETLTGRELEILTMIALGSPNKVIGAQLFISEKTVKTHTNHIFRKLGVTNRLQATLVYQSYQRAGAARLAARRRRK